MPTSSPAWASAATTSTRAKPQVRFLSGGRVMRFAATSATSRPVESVSECTMSTRSASDPVTQAPTAWARTMPSTSANAIARRLRSSGVRAACVAAGP